MASSIQPKELCGDAMQPLMSFMMVSGMWWILPQLAATSKIAYATMKDGLWLQESRIACKVKGAVSMFKHAIEQKRIKKDMVDFLIMVLSPRSHARTSMITHMGDMLIRTSKCAPWSEQMMRALKIDTATNKGWKQLAICLLQLGAILVHLGYHNSMVFTLLETHVDLLIRRAHPKSKLRFRKVIHHILKHELIFCFLYTFEYRMAAFHTIPDLKQFLFTIRKVSTTDRMQFPRNLPSSIREITAFMRYVLEILKANQWVTVHLTDILRNYYGAAGV